MVKQTLRTEDADQKARVAYDMALFLWRNTYRDAHGYAAEPTLNEKEDFLDLVKDCIGALNTMERR